MSDDLDILSDSELEEQIRKEEEKAARTRGLTLYCLHCPDWRGVNLDEQREHIRSAHGVKRKTKNERTCVRCEETFISASKNAKYCSPLCRKKAELARAEAEDRYCPGCGDLLVNKPDQVHCCRRCLGIALHDVPQPGTDAVA